MIKSKWRRLSFILCSVITSACVAPGSSNNIIFKSSLGGPSSTTANTQPSSLPSATPTSNPAPVPTFSVAPLPIPSLAPLPSPIPSPTVTPTPTPTPLPSPSATSTGVTYYLAPASLGGSDSNNGLSSSSPWLTPKHAVNCGDTILALPSTAYSNANFNTGEWGVVSCPANNNVAWLKCETFDACKITASGGPGMYVDKSYWGIQGFEVNANASTADACFNAAPNYTTPVSIHHVIFANNIANGCHEGGFGSFNVGTASVDYLVIVGNIAYNAAQGSDNCYSGISIYEPVNSDTATGTHMYLAGNFSYGNTDPSVCAGGTPDGGDGIILDTFDGSQNGTPVYTGQAVVENNILIGNGARGLEVQNNVAGTSHAPIFLINNTVTGNSQATNESNVLCDEVDINSGYNIQASSNLIAADAEKGCNGNYMYGFYTYTGNSTDVVSGNFISGLDGLSTGSYASSGFAFGTNTTGAAPSFTSAVLPSTPSCSSYSSTAGISVITRGMSDSVTI